MEQQDRIMDGDLQTLCLQSILKMLALSGKTGTLFVHSGPDTLSLSAAVKARLSRCAKKACLNRICSSCSASSTNSTLNGHKLCANTHAVIHRLPLPR